MKKAAPYQKRRTLPIGKALWNRVIPALMERMALQAPLYREPSAFQRAVFLHRFQRVSAAGGSETAAWRFQGRNIFPVKSNKNDQHRLHHAPSSMPALRHSASKAFSASLYVAVVRKAAASNMAS